MKKIFILIFITVSIYIIYNFFNSVYRVLSKREVITQAQNDLKKAQQENTELKKELGKVKNPDFIEEQARDKLFLVKPGESTVIIPTSLLPSPTKVPLPKSNTPHWKEWIVLFFH